MRLPISWGNLEPFPGAFYHPYLGNYVDRDVRWAKKHGLYIVLDMHQFNWAQRFGGVDAPEWTVAKYSPTDLGKRQAVSDFWNNTELQTHFINLWGKIAQRYVQESSIVGYDNASHVKAFYTRAITAIRKVDVNHLFFLEPANLQAAAFPLKQNIVWSPHFYKLSFARMYYPQNITLLKSDFFAKYKKFVLDIGGPMWIGEFGAFMKDSTSSRGWLQDAIKIFNKYQTGWAWWAFDQNGPESVLSYLSSANA